MYKCPSLIFQQDSLDHGEARLIARTSSPNEAMAAASLESLSPELQTDIMRSLNSLTALYSLIRASPRFFQVFRSRKEYLLTQLAFQQYHPDLVDDLRKLGRASQMEQPPTMWKVWEYQNLIRRKDFYDQPQIPPPEAVLLCQIGPCIRWFVEDYRRHSLGFLANFVTELGLQQDPQTLNSDLSDVEYARIQRAFVRFENFRYLFAAEKNTPVDLNYSNFACRFMNAYAPDEAEEIVCVRDYLVRRLWETFESIEDDALQEHGSDGPIRQLGYSCMPYDWFSYLAKPQHLAYMEYLMSLGLPFLRQVFESDGLERADLVISNSYRRRRHISEAASGRYGSGITQSEFDDGYYDGEGEYEGEEVDALSQGLLWANRDRTPTDWGRPLLKGLRDWGYVFWSRERLQASGVLDKE